MTRSFVGDGELLAAGVLVLATDEVGDLLVLGLLHGVLVALLALAQELLLDEVDACEEESVIVRLASQARLAYPCPGSPRSSRPAHHHQQHC
jgi:hypothetical protein